MKKILAILLILCCCMPAVAKRRQNEEIITPLSQLEKRQFQTRTYPANDNVIAMKAILNVLQDEGFIVYNVNSLLGYIYGVKDFDLSDPNIDISKEFGVTKSRLNYNGVKVATLEVSVNVTQYGEKSRIRANFKRKLLNQYGNAQMIDDISEIEFYDDFYSKVDSAMNLQKQISDKVQNTTSAKVKQTPVQKTKTVKPSNVTSTEPAQETEDDKALNKDNLIIKENSDSGNVDNSQELLKGEEQEVIPEPKNEKIKSNKSNETKEEKEDIRLKSAPEIDEELSTVAGEEQASSDNSKELKELIKQAKQEAKQAQKEAKQAEKEARRAQKEALKAAKQQAKENEE